MTKNLLHTFTLAAGLLALSESASEAAAPTIVVSTTAQLLSALKTAVGGSTIELAPGTYTGVVLSNLKFAQNVTITSQVSSHPATLVGLGVANSSGVNFSNLELTSVGSTDAFYAFRVAGSSNLNFTDLNVHGSLTAPPGSQLTGFYFNKSSNITITDSHMHNLNTAISAIGESNIKISNNQFDLLNKTGVLMSGSSNVQITNNSFTDFKLTRGTHPDAIQLFTANSTTSAHDITITGNLYTRGNGDPIQGIFIKDEVGNLPYKNLTVSDNAIIGGMWNSIYIQAGGKNLQVNNNVLATWPGLDVADAGQTGTIQTTAFQAFLYVKGTGSVSESGNSAQVYLDVAGHLIAPPLGNTLIGAIADNGNQLLQTWLAEHPTGTSPPPPPPPLPPGSAFQGVLVNATSFSTGNPPIGLPPNLSADVEKPLAKVSPTFQSEQILAAAVPEPEEWAILIVGFGFIGTVLRRLGRRLALPQ